MRKPNKRNYIINNCKIIIKKFRTNVNEYVGPTISNLISNLLTAFITKIVLSKNTILKPAANNIKKSSNIYFLILSAMILLTYYYLQKC